MFSAPEHLRESARGEQFRESMKRKPPTYQDRRIQCLHIRGYWLNESRGSFRCLACGYQVNAGELRPRLGRTIEAKSA